MTIEDKNIINDYTSRWDKIIFSTKPVDREKERAAVLNAYNLAGSIPTSGSMFAPDIYFLTSTSPEQGLLLKYIWSSSREYFGLKNRLLDGLSINKNKQQIIDRFPNLFPSGVPYISSRSEYVLSAENDSQINGYPQPMEFWDAIEH
jgi:hypothetical protein